MAKRVADLGWHVQIHMRADQIVENAALLEGLPTPVVFDHLGRLPQPAPLEHAAFGVIRRMIDKGRTWVKLSGAYMDTNAGAPTYADKLAVAQAYIKAAPERVVWGSDWPHPTEKDKPNDATLFDLLADMGAGRRHARAHPRDQPGSALRICQGRVTLMAVKAIITGATGMVGEGVLLECLAHPDVEQVLVINRKPGGVSHPKLREIVHADLFNIEPLASQLAGYNACFFCLGVSSVGMDKDDYRRITYDLTLGFAQTLARINPDMTFCYRHRQAPTPASREASPGRA